MRRLAILFLLISTISCASPPSSSTESISWPPVATLWDTELTNSRNEAGLVVWQNTHTRSERERFRKFYEELNGKPGRLPAALADEAREIYGTLTNATFASPPPPLRIADCGSASARVNVVGEIELCRGAMFRLNTRDEIAYLLAHELGHVLLEHDDILWNEPTLGADLQSTLFFTTSLGKLAQHPDTRNDWLSGRVSDTRYSRDQVTSAINQHIAADLIGMDIMARAGFSTDGAYTALGAMGGSAPPPPGHWNEYTTTGTRLSFVQEYAERFHLESDLKPQTDLNWKSQQTKDVRAFTLGMNLLEESLLELAIAKKITQNVIEAQANYAVQNNIQIRSMSPREKERLLTKFYTPKKVAARRLFCDSALSKLQHAHEVFFQADRQIVELALGIESECTGVKFDFTEVLLVKLEDSQVDGHWRETANVFTLFSMGQPSNEVSHDAKDNSSTYKNFTRTLNNRFQSGEALIDAMLREQSGNLGVIGSLYVLNANMRLRYDDGSIENCLYNNDCRRAFKTSMFERACRRHVGKPFAAATNQYCDAYIDRLTEQMRLMADRTAMADIIGRSTYQEYLFPAATTQAPDGISTDPTDYNLYDWKRGNRLYSDKVIADHLNMRDAPSLSAKTIDSYKRNANIIRTGRVAGEWIEVWKRGTTGWVHGKYLLRSKEIIRGNNYHRALQTLGVEGEPNPFNGIPADWSKIAWQTGSNPAHELLKPE
ncbi:SH3 domain-containing protein [Hyphomonas atlantica corrig.]|uniref:SH3 domain-containing protein n=1 Tax=Hyphomonas atlantica TaxID=1280948 RepID=UPI002353CFC0|nr:SH3 domain-containing protein [Hyphomonas atlantica]